MHLEAFKSFLITRAALMPVTVEGYLGAVKRITRVIGEHPDDETVEKYVSILYTSDYSYHHKINNVLALEKYMEFIGRPTRFGRQRKPKSLIKNTLTEGEVTQIIFNSKNIREKAIVALLAYSGIRNKELCNLQVSDVLLTQNALRINQGKFAKDGLCEITPECSQIIYEYLQAYPRTSGFLFTTLVKGNQLHTQDVRKLVKVLSRRAKITKRVYPHLFRHSLTANMILRGADIISLKTQLRHSWLESTLHYANSIVFVEKNRYQKFAPSYI